jgi:hypothetical protein
MGEGMYAHRCTHGAGGGPSRPHLIVQWTFLLNWNQTIHSQIEVIGDLREMAGVLELVGFQYNNSLEGGRISKEDELIQEYYPRRKDLLSSSVNPNRVPRCGMASSGSKSVVFWGLLLSLGTLYHHPWSFGRLSRNLAMTCLFRAWAVDMLNCWFWLYSRLDTGCRGRGLLGMITSAIFCMQFWMILTDWPLWRCRRQHEKARRSKSHSKCHVAVGLGYVAHFVPEPGIDFNGRAPTKVMWRRWARYDRRSESPASVLRLGNSI